MTRRALLAAACALLVPASADAAPRRYRIIRARPRKPAAPPVVDPGPIFVRTIRVDPDWNPHPTFDQRWRGQW